jgi:hypothetical protein
VSDALPLGRGADLTVLASGADGSALLLTHASLRVLLPGGVPLANLSPAHTAHLTLLVLDPRDLETTPAQDWLALGARSVIYTPAAGEVPPSGMGWRSTSPGGWYTLSSDGARIWVEGQ